ncbi:unnamed protein product [Clavelina lepadiformis]|uniref:Uncharacterized protein n=1 Tax=Clavelina lepadiformis TaxID=159417 RepID=A0ABP0EX10_CLALP
MSFISKNKRKNKAERLLSRQDSEDVPRFLEQGKSTVGYGTFRNPDEDQHVNPRAKTLWEQTETKQVVRLLGLTTPDNLGEEDTKNLLKEKKVWPFYYPDPANEKDIDCFPVDLWSQYSSEKVTTEDKPTSSTKKSFFRRFKFTRQQPKS